MTKRKSGYGSDKRKKDRERKRLKRSESKALSVEQSGESSEPSRTENGGGFCMQEQGSIGLPPIKEKPLARVQASPCEKMHSNAPRLPTPWGSRLIVLKDKSAHPDSPAWVCTPARVPDSGMWSMPDSAGQTHLASPWKEEVKGSSKKIGEQHKLQHKLQHKQQIKNMNETNEKNEFEKKKTNEKETEQNKISDTCDYDGNGTAYSRNESVPFAPLKRILQGSFHQGESMFGENAGTQCVAMSLAALAYHKRKATENWDTGDMNKILITGNELYSYLQCSSTMHNRYLLASELPQHFECFESLFEFQPNEALASLINLSDNYEVDHDNFNSYSLLEALQVSLDGTDGCFVCFEGNTFLVGKTGERFFTFDSHSRSNAGYLCANGKSTRVMHESIQHVHSHILSLAQSMGYARAIQCDITGVQCSLKRQMIMEAKCSTQMSMKISSGEIRRDQVECEKSRSELQNEDIEYIGTDHKQLRFLPLSTTTRKQLCQKLSIPYLAQHDQELGHDQDIAEPLICKDIVSDGNCFFRAVSFCLTGEQTYHNTIRLAVCNHLLQNKSNFNSFLRCGENTVESYLAQRNMFADGTWATEVEIFALSHLLKIDIHTYTNAEWITFSGQMVDSNAGCWSTRAIYLNHKGQNHYDVVTNVGKETQNLDSLDTIDNKECNRQLWHKKIVGTTFSEHDSLNDYRSSKKKTPENKLRAKSERYKFDENFRMKSKARSVAKYRANMKHKEEVKERSKVKYKNDNLHRQEVKQRSSDKYKTNEIHRQEVKQRSSVKYKTNEIHRQEVKQRSSDKYKTNEIHRQEVKQRSSDKYKTNEIHRQEVKQRSSDKYKTNEIHRQEVKQRSSDKYKTNEIHRQEVKQRSSDKYKTNATHRQVVKQRSVEKYKTNEIHRQEVKQRSVEKYKANERHREDVKCKVRLKYNTDKEHKESVKEASRKKYHSSVEKKLQKKSNVQKQRNALKEKLKSEEDVIHLFQEEVKKGPEFTCCCHRLLFENQVQRCAHAMYDKSVQSRVVANACIDKKYVHSCSLSCSINCAKSLWICFTCHRKLLSGCIPAEATANKMSLENIPMELRRLNSLEQHLIALHIPFMKVMALPQGRQKNIHGPVVCVPSNLRKTTSLPLTSDENLLLRVKLKRKLSYKGYYEYQFVKPNHVLSALKYLKENNKWYQNVVINTTWGDSSNMTETSLIESDENESQKDVDDHENENPEIVSDTCLQPVDIGQEVLDHFFDDVYSIAPGEGHNPIKMLQEVGNEAKTFPHLFPTGKFSWNEDRDVKITLSRYFNNRLLNTDNRFAKDTNYIFFCQFMSELNQVIEKTQISIRKSLTKVDGGKTVTAEMVKDPVILSRLLRNNEALRFMQPIRGTPAYWSSTQKDLFAMLRQLGIPTWFCSFSSAEFRWNDIVAVILNHENDNRDPTDLDWAEKSEILRNNPVTVARMFDHRFHVFQRDVIFSPANPIGKVVDYFVRVEFQQRGSPHMHCLYWVEHAPTINEDSEESICDFIDRYITCAVPSEEEDPEMKQIVLDVQQHSKSHSKSCRKKGTECRFNFPRPPSEKTFISRPCEQKDDDLVNEGLSRTQAKDILLNVWNAVLNENNEGKSTTEIFRSIGLTQNLYEMAHNVMSSKLVTILRRNLNEMWTNQYNPCLLRSWNANMDIQYILDPFSCIVYIVSYISKSEREMGMLLKQTHIEAREGNLSAQQTIRRIGTAYLNHREVSAQEAVYRVCNLKMKECSRNTIFVPVGENPTRLSKPLALIKNKHKTKIEENSMDTDDQDCDDDDIWMTNIVERYENRPEMDVFQEMCLAEFCSEYRVLAKSQIPKTEKDTVFELRNGKGFVQKRTRSKPAIVRYPRFNKENEPEKYYQAMVQLFLPYWRVDQLKPTGFDLYQTFFENGYIRIKPGTILQSVKSIVLKNHATYSKNENVIENAQEALENLGEPDDAWARLCPETELNRMECEIERNTNEALQNRDSEVTNEVETNDSPDLMFHVTEPGYSREEIIPMLQSLNTKQKRVFYAVREWCLNKISGQDIKPLHLFVTGGAGTGKSHLIKTINYEASRLFQTTMNSPSDLSVILTAFTGTAAFNIGGNTIHHAFSLNKALPIPYEPLKEQTLGTIRTRLEGLQILIIDEVSMVYKRLLYYIHERLVQIKKCKQPFGGVSVLAVGDFYQLPPVKQRKDERLYKENGSYPVDYWLQFFKLVELDEIMRQREDHKFAFVLNSLRIRTEGESISDDAKMLLRECIREGPEDVLHVYPTNAEANEYNLRMLQACCEDLTEVLAEDYQKDSTTGKLSLREKPYIRVKSDGLATSLLLAVNARVMLTRNVNVEDGLVNGAMGHVSQFEFRKDHSRCVQLIGVIFDNKDTGKLTGTRTPNGNVVLIQRTQEDIKEKNTRSVVRHQFPLKLAWACTAHKVQGMTTRNVVVNLDRSFSAGQAYVALSRVTSKNGLFIETSDENIVFRKIYADPDVRVALNVMDKFFPTETISDGPPHFDNFQTIILFNAQSLRRHIQDLVSDQRFHKANFIALTETWIRDGENDENFGLDSFEFDHVTRQQCYDESDEKFRRLHCGKGGGVGLYRKSTEQNVLVNALCKKNFEGLTLELCDEETLIVIVYRPGVLNVQDFLQSLWSVVSGFMECYSHCVIMGDFNEDAKIHGPIQRFLESKGFKQIVEFHTTEGGTTLDHVYISDQIDAIAKKMPVYFSYHEAIEIILKRKC